MATLTQEMLVSRSGQFDIESIQRVSLNRLALGKVNLLQQCTSLTSLNLEGNMLTNFSQLHGLPKLKTLDVTSNRITSLDGLAALTSLEHLSLEGNAVSELEELEKLGALVNLRSLSFRSTDGSKRNPVCSHPAYFSMIQRVLGEYKLQQVDGENLLLREAAQKLMLENAGVDEDEIKLPPSEPWDEDRHLRMPKQRANPELLDLENELACAEDEAKSLDAEAAVLISRVRAEAAAKHKKASQALQEALAGDAEEARGATPTEPAPKQKGGRRRKKR